MQIKHGVTRVVVLLPTWEVVLKFPRIYAWNLIQVLCSTYFLHRTHKVIFGPYMAHQALFNIRSCLLEGFRDNRSERRYWKRTKHPFLQPTLFSAFGVVNIQKMGHDVRKDWDHEMLPTVRALLGDDFYEDGHCFRSEKNFSEDARGKVCIHDYASEGAQRVLDVHADILRENI